MSLKAPVKRVTGYDVITPLAKLEDNFFPDAGKIVKAVEETMEF